MKEMQNMSPAAVCRICGTKSGAPIEVPEMMLGRRNKFLYQECQNCGCLQIAQFPADIAEYYPLDYYSYNLTAKGAFKRWRRGMRRRAYFTNSALGRLLLSFTRNGKDHLFRIYQRLGIKLNQSILDVGAGGGTHVLELREAGLKDAIGLDPYLLQDKYWNEKILVKKTSLEGMTGTFDLITFHHSLEHMESQLSALQNAKKLLAPQGKVLVRIPSVSSMAFEKYREFWFQIDAPRHYFLHSHKSISVVAEQAGLKVTALWCDSTPMQFIMSEQYKSDVPLHDDRSFARNKRTHLFKRSELDDFKKLTDQANKSMRGDQICVVMEVA
jgi:SAM-dependent methyltransferase